jgi:hypothetical protein
MTYTARGHLGDDVIMPRLTIVLAALAVLAQTTLAAACPTTCTTSTNVAGTTRTVCRAACPGQRSTTTTCTSTTNVAGTTRTVCRES